MKRTKILVIALGLTLVVIAFVIVNVFINNKKKRYCVFIDDFTEYAYEIEGIATEGEYFVVKGWFFELEKVRNEERNRDKKDKTGIMLWDVNSATEYGVDGYLGVDNALAMNMEYTLRQDVNKYFECEYDYSHCGFVAKIEKSKLDLDNKEYQIIIQPDEGGMSGIPSSSYISNGKLTHVSKAKSASIETEGTDLENIVDEGKLMAVIPEQHTMIYQYDWKLYWIVEKDTNSFLSNNENAVIQYMIDTTRFDKLPQHRIERGWYWDEMGSNFINYEITDRINCGKYRVYERDIPSDYPVTLIDTGCFENGEWIWRKTIRPCYGFVE